MSHCIQDAISREMSGAEERYDTKQARAAFVAKHVKVVTGIMQLDISSAAQLTEYGLAFQNDEALA